MDGAGGGMELGERDFDTAGSGESALAALRSASLPDEFWMLSYKVSRKL